MNRNLKLYFDFGEFEQDWIKISISGYITEHMVKSFEENGWIYIDHDAPVWCSCDLTSNYDCSHWDRVRCRREVKCMLRKEKLKRLKK